MQEEVQNRSRFLEVRWSHRFVVNSLEQDLRQLHVLGPRAIGGSGVRAQAKLCTSSQSLTCDAYKEFVGSRRCVDLLLGLERTLTCWRSNIIDGLPSM